MAVKADEVVQDLCNPMVDGRKRRKLPMAVTAGEVAQVIFCLNGGSGGRGEDPQRLLSSDQLTQLPWEAHGTCHYHHIVLDFADDLCLMAHKHQHIQPKTD